MERSIILPPIRLWNFFLLIPHNIMCIVLSDI
jgi:hypothetical protein